MQIRRQSILFRIGSEQRGRSEELADDPRYGRHAKEEITGDVSSTHRGDAGLSGL